MTEEKEPQTHRCENLKLSITLQLRVFFGDQPHQSQQSTNIPETVWVYIITKWKVIKPETLDYQSRLMWLLACETILLITSILAVKKASNHTYSIVTSV